MTPAHVAESGPADRLEGTAPAIAALREQIRRLAAFDVVGGSMVPTVLLHGETGTGKGLVARIIHDAGPRARGPFVPVNCAAIPETMLEAELFGYEAGAFTDAKRGKPGLFEAAAGGTLFLDEIDSLSLPLQSKLLTAIESKRIRRLGAVAEHAVDVKLLAATQGDLARLAEAGQFREDLYHRLAVVVLTLPPLRERGDDVLILARTLLARFAVGYGARPKTLAGDGEAWLRRQPWRGNVRELGHLMERATLLHDDALMDGRALERLAEIAAPGRGRPVAPETDEAGEIRDALARTGGNVVATARLLGLSRDTIRYRMRRHGIGRPELGAAPPAARPGTPPRAGVPASVAPAAVPAPAWEQKPVAIVVIDLTWPEAPAGTTAGIEPWTESSRWERAIREKLEGLGAITVQRSPSLAVWAFGLPHALEQLPTRAVHGALAVRNLVAGARARERTPELRIALHLGAMIVDIGARDPGGGALPVGETLGLPLRLVGEVEAGEIVASTELANQVSAWAVLDKLETRGRPAYRVAGLRPWRERAATPRRALSAFVGRERELATLRELVEVARAGRGQVVGVVGEPGAGKSRLLYELRQLIRGENIRYDEGHCLAHASMTPHQLMQRMLSGYFGVADSDAADAVFATVHTEIARLGADADTHTPYICGLLGIPTPGAGALDPATLRERTHEAFRHLVLALCGERPLVLVVENVHWIDPSSEECFEALVESVAAVPCLLVMTYRPGYRPSWLGKSYTSQIALRPLGLDDSRRLVRAQATSTPFSPALEDHVLATAEGNPFFLEELTRSIVEQEQTGRALPALPETIHAALAARIDRLEADDKQLLQTAAVVGREVPLPLLAKVARLDTDTLEARLERLVAREFLFERAGRPERTYSFRHALTQVAAYQTLPRAARTHLHQRAAEAMETLGLDQRPELLETLARHAAEAGDWPRALSGFRRAAEVATARHAPREAARCFEQAAAALSRLPEGSVAATDAGDLRVELAHALYWTGDLDRARQELDAAKALARRVGDEGRVAKVLTTLVFVHAVAGQYEDAVGAGEAALAVAETLGDATARAWASIALAQPYFALGRYRRAAECARSAADITAERPVGAWLRVAPALLPAVTARTWLALSLARTGELAEAARSAEDGLRCAEGEGALNEMWACYGLGRALHALTDFEGAISVLSRAARLCEGGTFPVPAPRVLSGLASSLTGAGRALEAFPLLERAFADARASNVRYGHSLALVQLGEACLTAGRLDEAATHALQALEIARARGERGDEAWALHLRGAAAARRQPAEIGAGREWYAQALALADDLGMQPLVVRCRLSIGALEHDAGRRAAARGHLTVALAMARTLGITAWAQEAERLLAESEDVAP